MKRILNELLNLLLVALSDYVFGAVAYLLLEQPTHVALSNGTVSVDYQNCYGGNATLHNTSVLLLDASTNRTIAKKQLPQNQSQGRIGFECFHFKSAGNYWFRMVSELSNDTDSPWNGESILLHVTWPAFHIDLRAASERLQVGLFTNEYLCPMNKTVISLDVIMTSSLDDLGRLLSYEDVGLSTKKGLSLSRSQWVMVDCHSVGQVAYVAALLKSAETNSVIASTGPVDLVRRFGHRLAVAQDVVCESSVAVSVTSPPCTPTGGHITVFKESLGPPGQKRASVHESVLKPEDNRIEINCTLFDEGTNKYCFQFSLPGQIRSPPGAKECVLIQRNMGYWSLWQTWSPCSKTCGDGVRERYRECLASFPVPGKQRCPGTSQETSLCSLEECSIARSASVTPPLSPDVSQQANKNLVAVTGISLCLSIIFATVFITLWRKLCHAQKCSPPKHCGSTHSPGFRKNSDEENICQGRQQRESFSEEGEIPYSLPKDLPDIPLNFRRSLNFAQDDAGGASASDSIQSSAQKIIPPIFSYRLAHQQLKEMKKKGLTETTKVYHVSQDPLTDTVTNTSMSTESQEAAVASKFRIQSPFLDSEPGHHSKLSGDGLCSRVDFAHLQASNALSLNQSLTRRGQPRAQSSQEQLERDPMRSSRFRRTASFHETRKKKPFRKRSMSSLLPGQTPAYRCRSKTWDRVPEEQHQLKSKGISQNAEMLQLHRSMTLANHPPRTHRAQNCHNWEPDSVGSRAPASQVLCGDPREHKRHQSAPFVTNADAWRKEHPLLTAKDNPQGRDALSPAQYRKSRCQSFPADPEYLFYDNTSFGQTESEQPMIGTFGPKEVTTLSIMSQCNRVMGPCD